MSPDLEAAGREVVDAPVAQPSAVEVLERRARRRRGRRATAMGALALALVVGIAAVAVAATRDDDAASVVVAPPTDLACERATHDFGNKIARSIWTVTADGVTVGAARVWDADGTANIATWTSNGTDPAPELAEKARGCVTNPPVLALDEYPARGLFVEVPGDPTELVVDADGTVLGSRNDDADIVEGAPTTPPGTLPDDIAQKAHWETRTWPSPDGKEYLQQRRDKCQRTTVHVRSSIFNGEPFGGYPETDVFSIALGWLTNERAAALVGTQICAADQSSLKGVYSMTRADQDGSLFFPAIDGKLEARVFQRVIPPTTTFPRTTTVATAVPSATTTVPTTTGTPKIVVPNVVGLDADAARAALVDAGLNASVLLAVNPNVVPGTAYMQEPNAGAEVDLASTVVVHVAIESTGMSLAEARALWGSRRVAQYSFEYQKGCFCPPAAVAKVRITVRNGTVVDVVAVDPQEPEILDQSDYPSVEKLFDLIEENEAGSVQRGGSMRVAVKYAAGTGVPLSIDITCADERIADCGVTHTISNLEISG